MLIERKKILAHRLIWFIIVLVNILLPIFGAVSPDDLEIAFIFSLPFFIGSLTLSYKKYDVNGNEVIVYAGWFHHYLKINGELYDEHNTLISFTHISLSCVFENDTIECTISMSNRISTKVNGKIIKPSK